MRQEKLKAKSIFLPWSSTTFVEFVTKILFFIVLKEKNVKIKS